jgi:peptidoglycan/xylan/chitin deacetylase (PgdA/CDA1 family)
MAAFLAGERLGPRDAILTFDDGYRSFLTCVMPVLRDMDSTATVFIVTDFVGRCGSGPELLSWDDVADLSAEGIEFGCHGTTHVPFDQVGSERMRWEVQVGTAAMEEHGLTPAVFAYPFGRFDGASKLTVRKTGYQAAFSGMRGGYDRYEIRRRPFAGLESPLMTRFVMSDRFFEVREAARKPVPRRFLKQEHPIAEDRWGPEHFGLDSE